MSACSAIILKYIFQIDPTRTISAGKVNLGAFRTYPKVTTIAETKFYDTR